MRHTEIPQSPCQRGNNRNKSIGLCGACRGIVALRHAEITRQLFGVCQYRFHSTRLADSEKEHNNQGSSHYDRLNKIRQAGCQKPSHGRVENNNSSADQHGGMVIHPEKRSKKFPARSKAGPCVRDKENDDNNRPDQHQNTAAVPVAIRKKIRDCDGVCPCRVPADSSGYQKPVKIRSYRQTDFCPAAVRDAGEIGQTRKPHKQIAAHIRGLRTHSCDQRPQLPSAQIKVTDCFILFRNRESDQKHSDQIYDHGNHDPHLCICHIVPPQQSHVPV